jgi:hypothetical protein
MADIVGDSIVSNPYRGLWYGHAAFTEPQQPYRNGTTQRNSLRGSGKGSNVYNHVNLGLPNSTIDSMGQGSRAWAEAAPETMKMGPHV